MYGDQGCKMMLAKERPGGAWGEEFLRSGLDLSDAVAAKPYIIPIRMSLRYSSGTFFIK